MAEAVLLRYQVHGEISRAGEGGQKQNPDSNQHDWLRPAVDGFTKHESLSVNRAHRIQRGRSRDGSAAFATEGFVRIN